jgi:leucyl aminopeptidase
MKFTIAKVPHHATTMTFLTKEEAASSKIPDFDADKKDITVRYVGKKAVILCGLGARDAVTSGVIRSAAAAGIRKALSKKRSDVSVVVPSSIPTGANGNLWASAALEGVILGAYSFVKYKKEKGTPLSAVELCGDRVQPRESDRILAVCECVNYARDLVNENAHIANPEFLVREARGLAKAGGMTMTVLDEKGLQRKGLGLLAAVGQGSPFPPRLAIIEYRGSRSSKDKTAIVGKGITFDSGGQNLKPTGHIETMRQDMAGAAAVLGVMKAIGMLKPKVNVVGVCPFAHNAIGEHSYFPGDVYKAYDGTTVEIESTDAEGRLILADAIAYCKDAFSPSRIIDLATLTGGILASLGTVVAGLFSNNDDLAGRLFAAGEETNERLWRFPLYREYIDSIKSDIADLRNISSFKKGWASSITGAAFIGMFADKTPWAHLDIAGTAFNEESARGELPQFATGFGVRLLLKFLGVE